MFTHYPIVGQVWRNKHTNKKCTVAKTEVVGGNLVIEFDDGSHWSADLLNLHWILVETLTLGVQPG